MWILLINDMILCPLKELCFRENLLRKYFLIILNYNSQTQFIL